MKNIFKTIGVLALSSVLFTACDEDDYTGNSVINYTPATVTLSTASATSFSEAAIDADDATTYTATITANVSEPQPVQVVLDLVQTGGSANSSDFAAGTITIPAGGTSASATVEIMKTGDIEGDETLMIGAVARNNANVAPFEYMVTITDDYINDVLDVELTWEGSVDFEDDYTTATYDLCAIDFDLLIYTAAGADTGLYDAATGACPEHVDLSQLPDGDYILVASLYANDYSTLGLGETVPLVMNYSQEYFDTEGSISLANYTTDMASGDTPVANVTKSGYNYTVTPW